MNEPNFGNLILRLRFSSKFHLQMSCVLSQMKRHEESLIYARLAQLYCEDNIEKSNVLRQQLLNKLKLKDLEEEKIKNFGESSEEILEGKKQTILTDFQ